MSERFIKLVDSEEKDYLRKKHPWAFLLLTLIAERVRRLPNSPDGLEIGEAFIGDYEECGIPSRGIYRHALGVLSLRAHIKIIETCRSGQKATIKATTKGTKVKLLSSNVCDANLFVNNHQSNHRTTTEQPPNNHEQEETRKKRKKKNIKEQQQQEEIVAATENNIDDNFSDQSASNKIIPMEEAWKLERPIDTIVREYMTKTAQATGTQNNSLIEHTLSDVVDLSTQLPALIKHFLSTLSSWNISDEKIRFVRDNYSLDRALLAFYFTIFGKNNSDSAMFMWHLSEEPPQIRIKHPKKVKTVKIQTSKQEWEHLARESGQLQTSTA